MSTTTNSILLSTKKMLGIPAEHTQFDPDIIMHINTVFTILQQLGVGSEDGFQIEDDTATWDSYYTDLNLNAVKSYMFAKVRLLFDPPTSGIVLEALKNVISEMEWRLNVQVDTVEDDPLPDEDNTASEEDIDGIINSIFD